MLLSVGKQDIYCLKCSASYNLLIIIQAQPREHAKLVEKCQDSGSGRQNVMVHEAVYSV